MKLLHNTIYVNDLNESMKFYEDILGLKLSKKFSAGPNDIAFFDAGGAEIELIKSKKYDEISHSEYISFGFNVTSIDSTIEKFKEKGISIHSGPFQPNPNTKFFFIQDPNGVLIQLVEQH